MSWTRRRDARACRSRVTSGLLEADLLEGARAQNRAGDEALVLPGGYVEVIATKA